MTRAHWLVQAMGALAFATACDRAPDPPDARAAVRASPVAGTSLAAGGSRHFASFSHTCAVVDGGLQCWGADEAGQLGDRVLARRSPRPVVIYAPGSGVTAVAAGAVHTCAVVDASVRCWGGNWDGQAGVRRPYIAIEPQLVPIAAREFASLAAGDRHTCVAADGGVWCWGANDAGQAGPTACRDDSGPGRCTAAPARLETIPGRVDGLALGRSHSCAAADGGVQCWGANDRGQLGDGSSRSRADAAVVRGLPGGIERLAVGGDHGCVVASDQLWCWGANEHGQLGDGTTTDRHEPVQIRSQSGPIVALATGDTHTCAATHAGVWCWGSGDEGQLDGTSHPAAVPSPTAVPGLAGDVIELVAGTDHSCAMRADRSVLCWGADDFGQLGDGPASAAGGPVRVAEWDDGRLRDRNGDGRIAVACLGDSNTQAVPGSQRRWCESLAERANQRGWRVVNRAEGGATAVTFGSLISGDEHLDYTLRNDDVDAVILAYGTNDLRITGVTPLKVLHAYTELWRRAHEAGVDVFVALTPPTRSHEGELDVSIGALNKQLAQVFSASRVIDFWSGVTPDDFVDELHLGASGHDERAQRAWAALTSAADSTDGN